MSGSWWLRLTLATMGLLTAGMLYGIWEARPLDGKTRSPPSEVARPNEPVTAEQLAHRIAPARNAAPVASRVKTLRPSSPSPATPEPTVAREPERGEPTSSPTPLERLPRTPEGAFFPVTGRPSVAATGPRLFHPRADVGFARTAPNEPSHAAGRVLAATHDPSATKTATHEPITGRVQREAVIEKLDAEGRVHRAFLDSNQHLIYEAQEGVQIGVAPLHEVVAFNFELDVSGDVHFAWYDDNQHQLHYAWLTARGHATDTPTASHALHVTALLGSPPEPDALLLSLGELGVKVSYTSAESEGYFRIDPANPGERVSWQAGP